jgi:hypothetical protein
LAWFLAAPRTLDARGCVMRARSAGVVELAREKRA